jgi:hypothetical protein
MTTNELLNGMIKNGLTKNWYTVELLGFALKMSSHKVAAMLKELVNDEKVIARKIKRNGKLEYKFIAPQSL